MRILQYMLGLRLWEGGVVRAVIDLCDALAQRGHEVTMMTVDAADAPPIWQRNVKDDSPGRTRLEVLDRNRLRLLTAASATRARTLLRETDVLHLHVPWDPICWQLGRMARWAGIPYVITVHGMLDDWTMAFNPAKKKLYLRLLGRGLLNHAATVHCTARIEQEQSARWYSSGRATVIPLLVDLRPFRRLPGPDMARAKFAEALTGQFSILFLGRLDSIKRVELLIDAAAILRDRGIDHRLLIVGTPEDRAYEARLRARVTERGLDQSTIFLGYVGGEEKLSLYQAVDVFVLPSAHESFGLALIESLACETPAVTTTAANIWPELDLSGGALIAQEQSAQALADAIASLHADPQRRAQMGRRGREWVHRFLDPQRVIEQYEEMYRAASGQ